MNTKKLFNLIAAIALLSMVLSACGATVVRNPDCTSGLMLDNEMGPDTCVPATLQSAAPTSEPTATEAPIEEPPATQPPPATATEPAAPEPPATNTLDAPFLHHDGDCGSENNPEGCFLDVGVKSDQIGIVFGWHIKYEKGGKDAGGDSCDLVILTPGWYEDLNIVNGRFEVYDVPSTDRNGWIKVLGQQRADEQSSNYACEAKDFSDLPQWSD